jgi:hypothetical protein
VATSANEPLTWGRTMKNAPPPPRGSTSGASSVKPLRAPETVQLRWITWSAEPWIEVTTASGWKLRIASGRMLWEVLLIIKGWEQGRDPSEG